MKNTRMSTVLYTIRINEQKRNFKIVKNANKVSNSAKRTNTIAPKNQLQMERYQTSAQTKGHARPLTANTHRTDTKGEKADTK